MKILYERRFWIIFLKAEKGHSYRIQCPTFVQSPELCVGRELFQQPYEAFFVYEGTGFDILGSDGDFINGVRREAGNGVLVGAGFDGPHLDVVNANGVLEV